MKNVKELAVTFLISIFILFHLLSCGKTNSETESNLSSEEKEFVTWADRTCVSWAESFNRELDSGNNYRILPPECIEFYKFYGGRNPLVVSSLKRYENEVVNGDRKVALEPNMLAAEMHLRWQNQMLDSIRYPNPVRDAILRGAMVDAQMQAQKSFQNNQAYKLRIPDQNFISRAPTQTTQSNPQQNISSRPCSSCGGSGTQNNACFSCDGTGILLSGGFRYKCGSCSGKGFGACLSCQGNGKAKY